MMIRRGLMAYKRKSGGDSGTVDTVISNRAPTSSNGYYTCSPVITLMEGDVLTIELSIKIISSTASYSDLFKLLSDTNKDVYEVSFVGRRLTTKLCGESDISKTYNSGIDSGSLKFVLYYAGGKIETAQAFVNDIEVYGSSSVSVTTLDASVWRCNIDVVKFVKITHSRTV